MRIGLNLLHALPEIGGVWNYIISLVAALGKYDESDTYVAFVTSKSQGIVPHKPNFASVLVDICPEIRAQRITYENTLLQTQARRHRLDCIHWFANTQAIFNAVPGLVTFYDLMVFTRPNAFQWIKRYYLQAMMFQTARRARVLLPMSNATARDLVRVLHADVDRMVVIPPVVDEHFDVVEAAKCPDLKAKYRLPDQFWLYVAHFYPHKNHLRLLQAYRNLRSSGFTPWPLVLCGDLKGADDLIRGTIAQLGLEQDVMLISRLAWSELPALYAAAQALIFPSLFEGAGMPVLEAMACGCPLVASNIASVQEFAENAAIYFDPEKVDSIGSAIITAQQDPARLTSNRRLGLARAAEFEAGKVTAKLLAAYRQAVPLR